jgi:hypothetical protein
MIDVLGTSWPVFVGITLVLMGFTSWMAGQALANTWRPFWQIFPYCLLLGFADRFLTWGLFEPDRVEVLWLVSGYVIDTAVLLGYALVAYRLTKVRKMVSQYPWIYEQVGPFSWREKVHGDHHK